MDKRKPGLLNCRRRENKFLSDLSIKENSESINFFLNGFHTAKESGILVGQEAILAFKLPKTAKEIDVEIKKALESGGLYPARAKVSQSVQ